MEETKLVVTYESFRSYVGEARWKKLQGMLREEKFDKILDEGNFERSPIRREELRAQLKTEKFFEEVTPETSQVRGAIQNLYEYIQNLQLLHYLSQPKDYVEDLKNEVREKSKEQKNEEKEEEK